MANNVTDNLLKQVKSALGKLTKTKPSGEAKTADDIAALIASIGEQEREISRILLTFNDEVAALESSYKAQILPLAAAVRAKRMEVEEFCTANRDTLTGGDRKTLLFGSGSVSWRKNADSLVVSDEPSVIEQLEAAGLHQFVRVPAKEIVRDAVKANWAVVSGISGLQIRRGKEKFVVQPREINVEVRF